MIHDELTNSAREANVMNELGGDTTRGLYSRTRAVLLTFPECRENLGHLVHTDKKLMACRVSVIEALDLLLPHVEHEGDWKKGARLSNYFSVIHLIPPASHFAQPIAC